VHVRFLLGPAGSGKTCRCLAEIQRALISCPDGLPLLLLAPKQATFQLERQLLADGAVKGYTRLQILSFDRLAAFIFENLNVELPSLLSAEGQLMVLRAILLRYSDHLRLFGQSARRTGFAQQLVTVLSELQQHQFNAARLRELAQRPDLRVELRDKLHDLAFLRAKYDDWLDAHHLQDADCYLDMAVNALRRPIPGGVSPLNIEHLWLDGFAEMTPQEIDLLAAILPFCQQATLAFCLDAEPVSDPTRLSLWSAIGKTFQQCRSRMAPDCPFQTEILARRTGESRFAQNPVLWHIESAWTNPMPMAGLTPVGTVNLVACANPEAEAIYAARAILRFVREGNRYRDCAVLVRHLDGYHQPLGRVFQRYGIPFFLDRRENVTHHPLAELTRSALRTVAYDWLPDDWFAALKAGFSPVTDGHIDRLENAALEFGWAGKKWREPLPDEDLEVLRQTILPPFAELATAMAEVDFRPNGRQLAGAIRDLWEQLEVDRVLEEWSQTKEDSGLGGIHGTVWEQMGAWLNCVELAFAEDRMSLREWLPILETGLAGLTVGVIPPVLDEVLIGAIDRSRNPDLKFALLLGVNETVFPATPAAPVILTNADRDELEQGKVTLGPNLYDQLARERYLGYIACTRASEKIALTFSRQDDSDKALNPSPFVAHLQRMFEGLEVEDFSPGVTASEMEHLTELAPWLMRPENMVGREDFLAKIPALQLFRDQLRHLREPDPLEKLAPRWADGLYGRKLRSSVSRLEDFAQCPFRFLVLSGLRAGERKRFELDARERGNFQHDILKQFHDELVASGQRWRDLTPQEARERIGRIAEELAPGFRHGLLQANARSAFAAAMLTESLQDFMETLVGWMHRQYDFDPIRAELDFGIQDAPAPAWEIELEAEHQLVLRGRIDRIDIYREGERVLCVVMDYKSSARKLDKILLGHGVQLQLPAYLAAVRRWPPEFFQAKELVPAGVFYVNLRGQFESADSRREALANAEERRRKAYQHLGRFNLEYLNRLDRERKADQFNYRLNKEGLPWSNSQEALACKDFEALLDQVEEKLRAIGRQIFAGEAKVDPYRKGSTTACDYCDYQAICRIDPWTHVWRVLRAVELEESA
jgi:ATP-dependent helicase/nuclease subunit B